MSDSLVHNIIAMPDGKNPADTVAERHDLVFLFDATKANPNGDPDAGNMPRLQPDSLRGLVTDVCLKRKVRNFFSLHNPDGSPLSEPQEQYRIFIRENAILKDDLDESHQFICRRFFNKLVDDLTKRGYVKEDESTLIKADAAFDGFPNKPKKCAEFVFSRLNGRWSFAPLLKEVVTELSRFEDVLAAVKSGLDEWNPSEEETKSEESMRKAIEKKAKALARGQSRLIEIRLRESFERVSPKSQVAKQFGELELEEENRDYVCWTFFDNRAFGCVVSTKGPLEGSFYGQVRGPIQITFAESLDKILQLDSTITRCAVASREDVETTGDSSDKGGNRTMGRKYLVDYGLYRAHIHLSPAFAAKTGFNYYDLDNFLFALKHLFTDDASAARTGMRVVALVDFQHKSALGNEHAHKLFEKVVVERRPESKLTPEGRIKDFPSDLNDYCGTAPNGLILGHEDSPMVTANRIVWEIAEKTNGQPGSTASDTAS